MTTRVRQVSALLAVAVLSLSGSSAGHAAAARQRPHLASSMMVVKGDTRPNLQWTRQFGTDASDEAESVAVDPSGNATVVGYTSGTLPGQSSAGGLDAFIRRFGADGSERWTHQFGTAHDDVAYAVAVDNLGNAYVAGYTTGTLPGQKQAGGPDGFVSSYAADGTERWTRQFGSNRWDVAQSIAVDQAGHVFVAGYDLDSRNGDEDGFVKSFAAADGTAGWTISLSSTSFDDARSVAVDAGGDVLVGGAYNSMAFVGAYSADGSALWTSRFAGALVNGIAAGANGTAVVVGTSAGGGLPGQVALGGSDAFVRTYTSAGLEAWTSQFGSGADDAADAVAVNQAGDIFVVGSTAGALPGQASSGGSDAFVRAYHPDGTESWTTQFGSSGTDLAFGLAVDGAGNVIVAGPTSGALQGQANIGGSDAYVSSYGACQIVVRVDSSYTLMPVLGALQLGFQAAPENAGCSVTVASGTTSQALADLQAGVVNAAAVSRPLTTAEKATLYAWQIGGDAMVIAVQDSPAMGFISNITSAQVQGIYTGLITNWSALGGPDRPIVARSSLQNAEDRSDLLRLFGIGDAAEQATIAASGQPRLDSPYDQASAAIANPYQIVYTSMANAHRTGLKALTLDGVVAHSYTVQNGTYPAPRAFYLAMRKNSYSGTSLTDWGTVKAEDLINYTLSLPGQQAVGASLFVPAIIPSVQPIPDRDVNLDGAIGLADLGHISGRWGLTSTCPGWVRGDVNNDGAIGLADIGLILNWWGRVGFIPPN